MSKRKIVGSDDAPANRWFGPASLSRELSCRVNAGRSLVHKETLMDKLETAIAVFPNHDAAEAAVKTLTAAGFAMKNLSVVGNGYHSEEKVVGFYTTGDRIKFWGSRGAFWGGFWGLFFGGLFLATPVTGPIVVLGFLATMIASAIENAVVVGGVAALGAALYSIGVPKDSVIQYESALQADSFLVMAYGTPEEMARAKAILGTANPARLDVHAGVHVTGPANYPVHAAG
jgi:hypothetical protein